MVDFYKALQLLFKLEFSSPKDALHKNPTEEEYTFMGIYERANPFWEGWSIIHNLMRTKDDVKAVSIRLYNDESIQRTVAKFYKDNFWDRMK
ncbi:MAG: peptidoglycan domain protein, partial [Campylobacter sp.]|nr:peptidoglycan domain protein [Campylobacter sp.]